MDVLIIYAHPSEQSFTFEVLNRLKAGLAEGGHRTTVSDLYKCGFSSDLSPQEYFREAYGGSGIPIDADVLEQQALLQTTDAVIFLYPVWWADCPAKLKGWFDRVYTAGFAYNKSGPREMKTVRYGVIVCTAGHSNEKLEESGIAESMRKVMMEDRLAGRFENKQMVILGGTLDGEKAKMELLEKAYLLGRSI